MPLEWKKAPYKSRGADVYAEAADGRYWVKRIGMSSRDTAYSLTINGTRLGRFTRALDARKYAEAREVSQAQKAPRNDG